MFKGCLKLDKLQHKYNFNRNEVLYCWAKNLVEKQNSFMFARGKYDPLRNHLGTLKPLFVTFSYESVQHSNGQTAPTPKPTQGDHNIVPGPRGAKRITKQASHRAGWDGKLLICAPAESLHCQLFWERKTKTKKTYIFWVQTCLQAYLVQFCQRSFIGKVSSKQFLIKQIREKNYKKISNYIFRLFINCMCRSQKSTGNVLGKPNSQPTQPTS